jgi:hypothetical protein
VSATGIASIVIHFVNRYIVTTFHHQKKVYCTSGKGSEAPGRLKAN